MVNELLWAFDELFKHLWFAIFEIINKTNVIIIFK